MYLGNGEVGTVYDNVSRFLGRKTQAESEIAESRQKIESLQHADSGIISSSKPDITRRWR